MSGARVGRGVKLAVLVGDGTRVGVLEGKGSGVGVCDGVGEGVLVTGALQDTILKEARSSHTQPNILTIFMLDLSEPPIEYHPWTVEFFGSKDLAKSVAIFDRCVIFNHSTMLTCALPIK